MLRDKQAVIFDMDGSLVDSMWIWTEVDRVYMKRHHLVMPKGFHKAIEGMSYTETAQYFLDTFPLLVSVEEIKAEWSDMTRDIYRTQVELKPGAREFLKKAHDKGILFGIATSNDRELAEITLKALKIDTYFQAVCTACDVKAGKPAPDVYLKAADLLGVKPEKCLVFEDVPNGIRAGKNAGMTVCAVEDMFSKPDEMEKRKLADYFIRDYQEIWDHTYDRCGE